MDESKLSVRERRVARLPPGVCVGEGTLQWNRGGWLGAQFGSSLWLALCGAAVLTFDLGAGLLILGCCLGANVVGVILWRRRSSLAPHLATQLLVLACFVAAAITFGVLYRIGVADEFAKGSMGTTGSTPLPLWTYLLVFPLLMILLSFIDRAGREK